MAFPQPYPRPSRQVRPFDNPNPDQPSLQPLPGDERDSALARPVAGAADADAAPLLDCGLLRLAFARDASREPSRSAAFPAIQNAGGAK